MAKKKVVNKNVIALLTVVGIVVSVALVGVATQSLAHKDPEVWARSAREFQKAGDFERAIDLFKRAYGFSKDPDVPGKKDSSYLREAADCAYSVGQVFEALILRKRVHAEKPTDLDTLASLLKQFWELREFGMGDRFIDDEIEYADKILAIEPENVLALATRAVALRNKSADDPSIRADADAALEKAVQADPLDPRVALARMLAASSIERERPGTIIDREAESRRDQFRSLVVEICEPVLAKHPSATFLIEIYGETLVNLGQFDQALGVIERAIQTNPRDPDLYRAKARLHLTNVVEIAREKGPAEQRMRQVALAEEAARKALELEPGFLEVYGILATLKLMTTDDSRPSAERFREALQVYFDGYENTLSVRSTRATISEWRGMRLLHLIQGFQYAQQYPALESDAAAVAERKSWTQKFLDAAERRYPENPLTHFMRGSAYIADRNWPAAINALEKAAQVGQPEMFISTFSALPSERLARLYREHAQPGESLKWTDKAIDEYMYRLKRRAPLVMYLNKAELLNQLDRAQEALDLLGDVRAWFPNENTVLRVMAASLQILKRPADAQALLAQFSDDNDISVLLEQARVASANKDDAEVERKLLQAIQIDPLHEGAMLQLLTFYVSRDRRDDAVAFVRRHRETIPGTEVARLLDAWEINLTIDDPARRADKFRELIEKETDPFKRAIESYNFAFVQNDYATARKHLDDAERLKPDDQQVSRLQLGLALSSRDFDRADRYAIKLAQANADQAGGATFRGSVALAKGDCETALREFREAERLLPTSSALLLKLAQSLICLNRYDDAQRALKDALASNPRDFDVLKMLFGLYRTIGDTAEARNHLEAAIKLQPNDPDLISAREFLDEEDDPRKGIGRREKRRADKPDDVDNLVRLGELYGKLRQAAVDVGRHDKAQEVADLALRSFREAIALEPASPRVVRAAERFFGQIGAREEGEKVIGDFIAAQSGAQKVSAQLLLARFYESLRDYDASARTYQDARALARQTFDTPDDKRLGEVRVAFEEADFYIRIMQGEKVIDIARWILSKLDAAKPNEQPLVRSAHLGVISGLLAAKKSDEAEAAINSFLDRYKNDTQGLLLRAEFWINQGELEKAFADLSTVLTAEPDNLTVMYTRGDLGIRLRRYEQARADLTRVKTLAREQGASRSAQQLELTARSRLAKLHEVTDAFELAESELRELIDLLSKRPDAEMVQQATADRLLRLFQRANRPDKSERVASEFMTKYPQNPYWPFELGRMQMARKQYSSAAGFLQTTAMLTDSGKNPTMNAEATALLLRSLARSNRAPEARRVFEAVDKAGQAAPLVRFCAAEVFRALGENARAQELQEQALIQGAAAGGLWFQQVCEDIAKELSTDAYGALLTRVADIAPNATISARIRNVLADNHLVSNRPAEALAAAEKAGSQSDPASAEAINSLIIRAQSLDRLGRIDEAVAAYEQLLERFPDDVTGLNNIAYLLADKAKRPADALRYSQKAIELARGRAPTALLDTHAWVLFLNKRYDESEAVLREALSVEPDYLPSLQHMAILLREQNRVPEARRFFQRLLDAAKDQNDGESVKIADEALRELQ